MKKMSITLIAISFIFLAFSCGKKEELPTTKIDAPAAEQAAKENPSISSVKKYTIKSGIIEYSYAIENIQNKEIVYFDDYGNLECKDTYKNDVLATSYYSDGAKLVKVVYKDKTAYVTGKASRGTEFKCDWAEIGEKQKKSGDATKLENVNILGKDCEQFQLKTGEIITKFAGWGGILLHMEQKTKYGNTLQKALKFEENAKVSPDKFKTPAGFTLKESGM
jgi:hypothetical protein